MNVHALAKDWAGKLCAVARRTDSDREDTIAYAIEGCLAVAYGIALMVVVGWAAGALRQCLLAAAAAAVLKTLAGGPHLSTPTRCAVSGAAVFGCLGLLGKHLRLADLHPVIPWFFLGLDVLLVWLHAPVAVPEKPLTERQCRILRVLARMLIAFLALTCLLWPRVSWQAPIAAGVTFQCLSLSKSARRVAATIDGALSKLTGRLPGLAGRQERRCED